MGFSQKRQEKMWLYSLFRDKIFLTKPKLSRHSQIIFIRRGFSLGSGDSTGDCFKSRLRRRLASLKRLFTTGSAIKRIPRFNSSPAIIKLLGYDPFSIQSQYREDWLFTVSFSASVKAR